MTGRSLVSLVLVSVLPLVFGAGVAHAAPKAKGKTSTAAKAKKSKQSEKEQEKEQGRERESGVEKEQENPPEQSAGTEDPRTGSKEEGVKAAGTATPKSTDTTNVKTNEDKEGVKTYKFQTVEVEGRLKSPQVIYFLRRVRAEFEAGALGHRSFLGELSDSRRSAAFR